MIRHLYLFFLLFSIGLSAQEKTTSTGFVENNGQIIDQKGNPNPAVKYLLNTNGLNVQLKKNGFSYDVYEMKKIPLTKNDRMFYDFMDKSGGKQSMLPDYSLEQIFHRVDINFENSNANVELIAFEKSTDYDNYYNILHAPEGILRVHKFQKVTYKNLYPNIDVLFFLPEDKSKAVEYNFIIHAGGKISDIKMKFNGLKTDLADSKIKMETRFGIMEETLPMSWTEDGMAREDIAVSYKKIKKNVYGFNFDESQVKGKKVIIDPIPVRIWATYYGGSNIENNGGGFVETKNSYVYTGGWTRSLDNIATAESFQSTFSAIEDGFIVKFDENGVRLWSTYYGGYQSDVFVQVAIDANDNSYVVGHTTSFSNIATSGCFQPEYNNNIDGMIVKFNAAGARVWGTYYGANDVDQLTSIKIDTNQDLIIAGFSMSINGLSTLGSFKETMAVSINTGLQTSDGLLLKFNLNGERIWATYYGGTGSEFMGPIAIDSNNNIFFGGFTSRSQTGIATSGAFKTSNSNLLLDDAFLVKFTSGGTRIFGTYYGGSKRDWLHSMKVDSNNNVLISGTTSSFDGIGILNAYQQDLMDFGTSPTDCFLAKFSNSGTLLFSTYFGGEAPEWYGTDIELSENDDIYLYSSGASTSIATPGAFQENITSGNNLYLVKFTPNGQRIWGTYYGKDAFSVEVAYAGNGVLYLTGYTSSPTNIATANAHQPNAGGNTDSFLIKFKDCLSAETIGSNTPICAGGTLELTASGGTIYAWTGPNGFTSTQQNPVIVNAAALNSGNYFCHISSIDSCDITLYVVVVIGDLLAPVPDMMTLPTITGNCNSLIIPIPTATDNCLGNIDATTESPLTYSQVGTHTIVWTYSDGTNISTQNQTIIVSPISLPIADAAAFFCRQENKTLADLIIAGQNIKWYNQAIGGSPLPLSTILDGVNTYYASQTIDSCESERVAVEVTVQSTFGPIGFAVQYFCDSQNATLNDFVVSGTDVIFYDNQFGGNILPMTTPLADDQVFWASQTVNGCESTLRLPIIANSYGVLPAANYATSLCNIGSSVLQTNNLSDYNNNIIANAENYTFNYYTNASDAENETAGSAITNFLSYDLVIGMNTIYVRVMLNVLCYKVVALNLNLISAPILQMKDTYAVCENGFVTLTADAGFDTYSWSTGANTRSITITQGGNYAVTVTKNNGTVVCSSTKNITVEISERAKITAVETIDWTSNDNVITVFVNGSGTYEYSVDGINFQSSNQFFELPNGAYTVYVNDIKGCGIAQKDIYLLMYPKFFTPNGDSYNDFWGIQFYQNELNLVVKIFDRFGKFIKQLTATDAFWDGTYNGQILPATDYWFTVVRENGKEFKGHFSLKR